jgi:hypothetical protein
MSKPNPAVVEWMWVQIQQIDARVARMELERKKAARQAAGKDEKDDKDVGGVASEKKMESKSSKRKSTDAIEEGAEREKTAVEVRVKVNGFCHKSLILLFI